MESDQALKKAFGKKTFFVLEKSNKGEKLNENLHVKMIYFKLIFKFICQFYYQFLNRQKYELNRSTIIQWWFVVKMNSLFLMKKKINYWTGLSLLTKLLKSFFFY
jgi:hypothetical protein